MCGFPRSEAVTTSDGDVRQFKALYVGTGGNVTIRTKSASGTTTNITFNNVPDGGYVLAEGDQIRATGTTASNIVRLW